MSDLISRQAVIDTLKETGIILDNDKGNLVIDEISRIPTAYDVDKVVEKLNNRIANLDNINKLCMDNGDFNAADRIAGRMSEVIESKEIVKAGGKE